MYRSYDFQGITKKAIASAGRARQAMSGREAVYFVLP
jgi:hypothetical protein